MASNRLEMKFRNHLLTEGGLTPAAHRVLKLLTIDVGLKLPNPVGIPRIDPVGIVARRTAPRGQQQQRAPVAPLHGHLLHLPRIDRESETTSARATGRIGGGRV